MAPTCASRPLIDVVGTRALQLEEPELNKLVLACIHFNQFVLYLWRTLFQHQNLKILSRPLSICKMFSAKRGEQAAVLVATCCVSFSQCLNTSLKKHSCLLNFNLCFQGVCYFYNFYPDKSYRQKLIQTLPDVDGSFLS